MEERKGTNKVDDRVAIILIVSVLVVIVALFIILHSGNKKVHDVSNVEQQDLTVEEEEEKSPEEIRSDEMKQEIQRLQEENANKEEVVTGDSPAQIVLKLEDKIEAYGVTLQEFNTVRANPIFDEASQSNVYCFSMASGEYFIVTVYGNLTYDMRVSKQPVVVEEEVEDAEVSVQEQVQEEQVQEEEVQEPVDAQEDSKTTDNSETDELVFY